MKLHEGRGAMEQAARPCALPVGDRTSIMLLALFVIFVVSIPKYDLPGVIAFASIPLLLLTTAGMPLSPLSRRLMAASPFILSMAAGNIILDRSPAGNLGGVALTGGMVSAAVITLKAMVTLTALLSLMAFMPFHRFGTALRSLGVPAVFVTQLLLVYRYASLLSEEAGMMQKARNLRSFNGKGKGPIVTARLIGALLIRTTVRAGRIYQAMESRGFGTAPASSRPVRMPAVDALTLVFATLLFLVIRIIF
ncbi:MAG: cobalt ABC transporter [Chlorobiaceae bacterium]|nr:cobalt ABC transporter [Chlorobiaceae bacterium]